jgi:hypothetical protein
VFNNGWSLISKSVFTYHDFGDIDYLWFSHEHPDHFFPPNLNQIPDQFKARITVLFQHTIDQRVVNYCRNKKFNAVIELKPDTWFPLAPDFSVLCEHYAEGDSWICFRGNQLTYLNTNDCGIRNAGRAQRILKKCGGQVDVLFTQFSYAYWAGNPGQKEYRQRIADEKLEWMKMQCDIFSPRIVVPMASYVYFSHEENHYLNDCINTARKTFDFISAKTNTTPVILYNGESYSPGEAHDSEKSILKYEADLAQALSAGLFHPVSPVAPEAVITEGNRFMAELKKNNSFHLLLFLQPATVFLTDLKCALEISTRGVRRAEKEFDTCDAAMAGESLLFCFKFPYGLDTTQINGRMRKPVNGSYPRFYRFFRINQLKSRGENPNSLSYIGGAAWRKLRYRLGWDHY